MTRALAFILSATLAASCAAQDPSNLIEYSVNAPNPELVEIGPGVEVVASTREPVFRASNAFWLNRDGHWYRNDELQGTWIRIVTPPPALASIGATRQYANYRPQARPVEERDLRTQREPLPRPRAPYPRPPQQEPPVPVDDPGTVDRVPHPTTPSEPPEPGELTRPDPMHD